MKNKCDVCGQDVDKLYVCSSAMGAISFAYCGKCLALGLEPYDALVGGLCGLHSMDEIRSDLHLIIERSLDFYGKTQEELFADIKKLEEDYEKYCNACEERV
jgi:hypothetical protein